MSADSANINSTLHKQIYRHSVEAILLLLSSFGVPVFFVPGNWDISELDIEISNLNNIDVCGCGHKALWNGFRIIGIGGSSQIAGHCPYEWQEEEMYLKIKEHLSEFNEDEHVIIVSHDPPFFTNLDVNHLHVHSGSETIRKIVQELQPTVCLTGHIHEGAGVDVVGETCLIVNAGSIIRSGHHNISIIRRNIDINVSFEEQFFIVDMGKIPSILVERYFSDHNRLFVEQYYFQETKLFIKARDSINICSTTGQLDFPDKKSYFHASNQIIAERP